MDQTKPVLHVSLGPKLPTPDFVDAVSLFCLYNMNQHLQDFSKWDRTSILLDSDIYTRWGKHLKVKSIRGLLPFKSPILNLPWKIMKVKICDGCQYHPVSWLFKTFSELCPMSSGCTGTLHSKLKAQVACTSCHTCTSGVYLSCKSWNELEMQSNQSNKMQNSANSNWFSQLAAGLLRPPCYW